MSRRVFRVALAAVALVGLVLRLWNLDFDERQHLHPDERHWALTAAALDAAPAPEPHGTVLGPVLDWLDGDRSPANVYRVTPSFTYGPLPLALSRGVGGWLQDGATNGSQPANAVGHLLDGIGLPLLDAEGRPRFDDAYQVDLIGRMLGALFDTITIAVIGLIGRRLAGRVVGLAAAGLYASSVLAVQLAHFLGAEPLLGLGCALTVLAAVSLDRSPDVRAAARGGVALGAAIGLAVAAKLTAAGLVVVPVVACVALAVRHRRRSDLVRLAAVAVTAGLVFRVLHPGAFGGLGLFLSDAFLTDLDVARNLASSSAPPSFQWANRLPVVQPILWMTWFTIGPGAMLFAAIGAWDLLRRRADREAGCGRWVVLVMLGSVAVPFAYIELTSLPTGRYYVPMLPAFMVLAGLGVRVSVEAVRRWAGWRRIAAGGVTVIALATTALWVLAFVHGVHGHPHTRVEATRWIVEHVPEDAVLSSQAWDDGLPLALPGVDPSRWGSEQLNMVGPDDVDKVERIAEQLGRIDYVVESSPRIWATVGRMPARFPSSIRFFDALDSGALGFERVATFTSRPRLGPFEIDDSRADEAFSVYDHPEVRIWAKVRTVATDEIVEILDPVAAANAVPVEPVRAWANGLLLHADEVAANQSGPTYDEAFDTDGNPWVHVVAWFLLVELIGLATFVLTRRLWSDLPDAGLGVAKIVGLGAVGLALFVWSTWLGRGLGRGIAVASVTALLACGVVRASRTRTDLVDLWRRRRPVLLGAEVVGVLAFVSVVLLRASNPDLWHPDRGGEKPFELALLTAVLRTETVPVYDPWFSGGVLNYHSGGWFLLSGPARVLATTPSLVVNIGLAVVAACTASALFTAGAAVARTRLRRSPRSTPSAGNRVALLAGVGAVVTGLVWSNLAVVTQTWDSITGSRDGPFDWWGTSRVIPRSVAITEFPAWSFLFGDLHPHVMGIAVLVTAGVAALALGQALCSRRLAAVVGLAAVAGTAIAYVRIVNAWDLPLAAGLFGLAVVAALIGGASWRRCLAALGVALAVVLVVWAPWSWRTEVYDNGIDPATLFTPLSSWAIQFGLFAVTTAMVIGVCLVGSLRASQPVVGRVTGAHLGTAGIALVALGVCAISPQRTVTVVTLLLGAGAAWSAWRVVRAPRTAPLGGALGPIVLAVGWFVQAGVETVTLRNDGGRMNTVFKFWLQSWTMLAVGSAAVLATSVAGHRRTSGSRRATVVLRRTAAVLAIAGTVVGAAFWTRATPVRLDDRVSAGGLSLDGEAYLRTDLELGADDARFRPSSDLALVEWLRSEVEGLPVIAEAPGEDYRWTSRFSAMTGLPTPIGWPYHESQQRRPYVPLIDRRHADLTALFASGDPVVVATVLERYDIAYVVFGTRERIISTPASAAVLRDHECLRVEFTGDGVDAERWIASVDAACVTRVRRAAR